MFWLKRVLALLSLLAILAWPSGDALGLTGRLGHLDAGPSGDAVERPADIAPREELTDAFRVMDLPIPERSVWSWGTYARGFLPRARRTSPEPVDLAQGAIAVASGVEHSLALMPDGTVWAWGLARPELSMHESAYPPTSSPVEGLDDIVAIAAGDYFSLALHSDGTLLAWGFNGYGQLGDGTTTSRREPRPVLGMTRVVAMAAGGIHGLALLEDGAVWAWGQSTLGALGNGSRERRFEPDRVLDLEDVTMVAAGGRHSMALTRDGRVWAWGHGAHGAAGPRTAMPTTRPMVVSGIEDVMAVTAGWNHSLAITRDGDVWAWGNNEHGQLGQESEQQVLATPQHVPGLHDIRTIAAGENHSLALDRDGRVWAWGSNRDGELGASFGSRSSVAQPEPVPGFDGVIAIAARGTHSLALRGPIARRLPPPTFAASQGRAAR